MALTDVSQIYSAATLAAMSQLSKTEKARPAEYESKWQETLDDLLDQIVNRKEFSYDYNQDPLYQNYKDSYSANGKMAMQDTAAQMAANTGGYGSSAATSAALETYNGYMKELSGKIPELYQLAMDRYQLEGNELQNKYSTVGSEEDRQYGQYRDTVTDWQTDRQYALNKFSTLSQADQWMADHNQNEFHFDQEMAYKYSKLT